MNYFLWISVYTFSSTDRNKFLWMGELGILTVMCWFVLKVSLKLRVLKIYFQKDQKFVCERLHAGFMRLRTGTSGEHLNMLMYHQVTWNVWSILSWTMFCYSQVILFNAIILELYNLRYTRPDHLFLVRWQTLFVILSFLVLSLEVKHAAPTMWTHI